MNVVLPTVFGPRSRRECPCVASDSRGSLPVFSCVLWARCKKKKSQWPSSFHLRRVVSHLAASSAASLPANQPASQQSSLTLPPLNSGFLQIGRRKSHLKNGGNQNNISHRRGGDPVFGEDTHRCRKYYFVGFQTGPEQAKLQVLLQVYGPGLWVSRLFCIVKKEIFHAFYAWYIAFSARKNVCIHPKCFKCWWKKNANFRMTSTIFLQLSLTLLDLNNQKLTSRQSSNEG